MCCNNRKRLPGKDDDEDDDNDDDNVGDTSIADIAATDDEVAEILIKYISQLQHVICAQIHHIFFGNNVAHWTLQYPILCHICRCA